MRIFQTDRLLKTSTHFYKPYTRYIASDTELDEIVLQSTMTHIKWSSFNSWERRYGGQDLNGKKVCIYRHNAWGDQLMASALPRYLKTLYPDSIVHLYCHPSVMPLWLGNTFVEGSAIPLPIPFDVATSYDYHIFYEGMLEGNSEEDQNCCYDDMFGFVGLMDVPDEYKRPYIEVRPEDYKAVQMLGIDLTKPYIVYHASPANMNRSYPLEGGVEVVKKLVDRFKLPVFVIGVDDGGKAMMCRGCGRNPFEEYATMFDLPGVTNLINRTKSFRDLIPIIEKAFLVICPDSSILHLTACFPNVPVISLWGLFHPQDRAKYYPNHTAIFNQEVCPSAPCRDHNFKLPLEQCKDAVGAPREKSDIKYCQVLASIQPDRIVKLAVEKIRGVF